MPAKSASRMERMRGSARLRSTTSPRGRPTNGIVRSTRAIAALRSASTAAAGRLDRTITVIGVPYGRCR